MSGVRMEHGYIRQHGRAHPVTGHRSGRSDSHCCESGTVAWVSSGVTAVVKRTGASQRAHRLGRQRGEGNSG